MKRKMALVFMTLVMAVSLAFGMTAITANAATELAWPETFATSDWIGPTELRLPTNYTDFNGGDLNPTAEILGKVKITRGETVYKASHVYGWENKLTFYFNGSNYNGQSAQRGDILTVDAGFSIAKNGNEYTSVECKQYIFTGAEWISGTELPTEAEAFVLGDVSSATGTQIEISNAQLSTGNDELDLTVVNATNITMKAADGEVYTPSHIRQIVSRKTFKLYFNNANANGKKYSFASAAKGDLLTIKQGFAIKGNYNLEAKEDINYIFTGSSWIKGNELPTEAEAFVLGDVSSATGTQIEISNVQLSTGNDELDLTVSAATDITMKAADGEVYTPSHIRQIVSRKTFKLYFNNANANGKKYSFASAAKGDLLTIKQGFAIKGTYNLEAKEDINYIYTGLAWIKGNELPAEKGEMTVTKFGMTSSYGKADALLYINTDSDNDADLGDADISYPRKFVAFTFADGTAGDVWYARVCKDEVRLFVRNKNGQGNLAAKSLEKGDMFAIKAGFAIASDGKTEVKEDINYIYNGTAWEKVGELPKIGLKITAVIADTSWNRLQIVTNTSNTENVTDWQHENIKYFSYVRDGVELTIDNYIILSKNYALDVKVDGASLISGGVSGVKKGDVITIKEGLPFAENEVLEETISFVFDGSNFVEKLDYTKFTKTGIATDDSEIILVTGETFVIPKLYYTYKEEVSEPEAVEGEVTVENAPDTNTVNEAGYDVTLKVGEFSVTIKVKVLERVDLAISNIIVDTAWNRLQIVTTSANDVNNTADQFDNLAYFSYVRDGKELTIKNYITLTKNYALDILVEGGKHLIASGVSGVKVGDVLTIKKGLPFVGGERLAETVSYVFDGKQFVVLVEPEDFELKETSATIFINVTKQIVVKAADGVTAVYAYVSENPEVATVSPYGVITGVKEGIAKIKVSYKDIVKEMTITVMAEPQKTGIEIISDIETFYVPVSTTEAPASFVGMGYTLKARYVYEGGLYGEEFDVTEEQIGDLDYTKAGNYDLKVTVDGFEAAVNVEVYNYREVTSFNTLGVSGYDINDDRNASGTWNGHMIIGMASVSTSVGNLLSTASCETMSEYIVYTTADGKTYYGKADKENGIEDRIGLWQLGTNLLVMIKPEGATANLGYGSEDHWKSNAAHPYVPVYKLGDKITFKKGMPIYAWKGALNKDNKPLEGAGCLIVEGYVTEDIVYFCYEENGTSSLWMIYKEYTDFTVTSEKTMALGSASPAGAVKVPADATTGTFTYVSDNPEVVSVTKDGNMLAEKVGTAVITITLTGGKDANGKELAPIVKTIKVTVKNGIKSVSGKITVEKGSDINLADYEITVKYSDGSEVNVKLNDDRIVVEDIDTSELGTHTLNVLFDDGNEQKRGTLTVEVVEKSKPADSGNGGSGCGGNVGGLAALGGLTVLAAAIVAMKKRED